jgi:hypothetical protein
MVHQHAAPAQAATNSAIQLHPEQQRLNQYILAEIAKMKQDNKRLNDEVLALRMENMSLSSRITNTSQMGSLPPTIEYHQAMPYQMLSKPQQELPFVEFDMRKQPPMVQSANVMFCSLLGYKTEEVLGKPWQYFIQDEFIERTVRMLQRDDGAKQVQFSQMYKVRVFFVEEFVLGWRITFCSFLRTGMGVLLLRKICTHSIEMRKVVSLLITLLFVRKGLQEKASLLQCRCLAGCNNLRWRPRLFLFGCVLFFILFLNMML